MSIKLTISIREADEFGINRTINAIGIDLVNGCNLSCEYCYISAPNKQKIKLSKENFLDILNFLNKTADDNISFYFLGAGEPTLNFSLLKEIPELCKLYGFNNCTFDITTNGTILTQSMIDFFKLNKFMLYISLDGYEEVNNLSRKYPNGKGSFQDTIHNIKLLQTNGIDFSCKAVLKPDNKNLIDTFSFFEENKIRFKFSISSDSFDAHYLPKIDELEIFKIQMEKLIYFYEELIKNNRKVYALKIIEDLKIIHYGAINSDGCGGAKNCFYIDIDGDIFPCSYHTSSKNLSVGNINDGIDYDKIIKNEFYAKPVDKYLVCANCWTKYLCSGSCFAIKWLENKDTNEPSPYLCKYNDIYWSAIIKLYIIVYDCIISDKNINFMDKK